MNNNKSSHVNRVQLIGNVGSAPKIVKIGGEMSEVTCNLNTSHLCVTKDGKSQRKTESHSVVWNVSNRDLAREQLRKGSTLYVEGELATWNTADNAGNEKRITRIVANDVKWLGSAPQSNNNAREQSVINSPQASMIKENITAH